MDCRKDSSVKFVVEDSYDVQKQLLIEELKINPVLTTAPALLLLTKENSKRASTDKFIPLNYEQVKYIIEWFREDNGIKNTESLNNSIILTQDNSLFLRYNSSFISLYKSKNNLIIYFRFIDKITIFKWLIFISPWQLVLLSNSDHWYLDGTFFSVPKGFYQMINISIFDSLSGLYIPLLWALATHKSYEMYVQLFWDIAKLLPRATKLRITVDFETKLIEALEFIFECDICGCYYHFAECLRRKAQKLGLMSTEYEKETQDIIQNLKNLSFSTKKICCWTQIDWVRLAREKENLSSDLKDRKNYYESLSFTY